MSKSLTGGLIAQNNKRRTRRVMKAQPSVSSRSSPANFCHYGISVSVIRSGSVKKSGTGDTSASVTGTLKCLLLTSHSLPLPEQDRFHLRISSTSVTLQKSQRSQHDSSLTVHPLYVF